MKKILFVLCIIFSFALFGCKVEQTTKVDSAMLDNPLQMIEGNAKIEVSSCTHYENKDRPSNSLIKANDIMKILFPEHEFEGCKNEGFNTFASYIIPVEVGKADAKNWNVKGDVAIVKLSHNNLVCFAISDNLRKKVKEEMKKSHSPNPTFSINIKYKNKVDNQRITAYACYVNDDPCVSDDLTINKKTISFKLSDASVDCTLKQGWTPIFMLREKK